MNIENLLTMTKKDIIDTRGLAAFIDFIFISILTLIVGSIVNSSNALIIVLSYITLVLLYFISFESLLGFTIGKFILGIRVINNECGKPTPHQSTVRALFWLVEVNPVLIITLFTFIIAKSSKTKQRFGDKVSNVYVVRKKDLNQFLSNENYQSMSSEAFDYHFDKPKVKINRMDIDGRILEKSVVLLFDGNKRAKIYGLKGMTVTEIIEEIEKGGRFVVFKSCVSAVFVSEMKNSDIYFIKVDNPFIKVHWPITLKTILFGWWSIAGFFWTISCLITNFKGGIDLTPDVSIAFYDILDEKSITL